MMRVFVPHASIHQNVTLTEELFNSLVDRIFIWGMQSVSCDSQKRLFYDRDGYYIGTQ